MSDYVIEVHTAEYRGDHAADVVIAIRPVDGESVEQLMDRFKLHIGRDQVSHLVLRPVATEDPTL